MMRVQGGEYYGRTGFIFYYLSRKHELDVFEIISENPVIWGSCEHLLYIGRKADL